MAIETARLLLTPLSLEFLDALPDRRTAEKLIGAAIPAGWPDDELAGLLSLYAGWLRADASVLGYGPWIAVSSWERTVVGSAGFVGGPKDGEIELGFGIGPEYRNRGYATEAAAALVAWALEQPGVERVVAECARDNLPSIRVLEKLGMTRRGAEGSMLRWAVPA